MPCADLDWLCLVQAPMIVTTRDGMGIEAANAAAERIIGPDLAGRTLEAALGPFAAGRLATLPATKCIDTEMVLHCAMATGLGTLGFRGARMADGRIALTLAEYGAPRTVPGRSIDWARTLEEIVTRLPVGVEIYDAEFNEMFANQVSDDLFAYPDERKIRHHDDWWAHGFPDPVERAAVIAQWREKVEAARATPNTYSSMEHEVTCRDGSRRTIQFRFRFIGDTYTVVFWDVTTRRRLEQDLRRLAGTDELTGLVNRRGFTERAQEIWTEEGADRRPVTLLLLDLDHFKRINDSHGHSVGDNVLREMALRCRRVLRPDHVLARVGGEEFALLLPETTATDAMPIAHRLLGVIGSEPMDFGSVRLRVQTSIGGASAIIADASLERLTEHADRALYAAKAGGRNRVVLGAIPPAARERDA